MNFPPGPAILVLLLLSLATAIPIALRRSPDRADLTIWTFDAHGVDASAVERFEKCTGQSVDVKFIGARALDTRLLSDLADPAADVPDLVEIEVGSIGKYFRPPVDQVGFLPLNTELLESGLGSQLLKSRLVPWSKNGVVFGLPQDVHPVSLTYRKDLFDAAGIDPTQARTWPALQALAQQFNHYWATSGKSDRQALMLSATAADDLVVMLQQRHVSLLDDSINVHLADLIVARTVLFYASLLAGDRAVAGEASLGEERWTSNLGDGVLCMLFTPDWRVNQIKSSCPALAGKLAMMPLPRFDADDSPTASWGGTMIGLPRNGHHQKEAWALAEALTEAPPSGVLPALPARWAESQFHQPDPFFAGSQSVDALYVSLATHLPPRVVTPFSLLADTELADVLRQAIRLQREHPTRTADDPDSMRQCNQWLQNAADDLRNRIRLASF